MDSRIQHDETLTSFKRANAAFIVLSIIGCCYLLLYSTMNSVVIFAISTSCVRCLFTMLACYTQYRVSSAERATYRTNMITLHLIEIIYMQKSKEGLAYSEVLDQAVAFTDKAFMQIDGHPLLEKSKRKMEVFFIHLLEPLFTIIASVAALAAYRYAQQNGYFEVIAHLFGRFSTI